MRHFIACLTLASAVALVACGKKPEPAPAAPAPEPPPIVAATPASPAPVVPTVGTVTLGNAVGTDKKISTPLETFGVKDKIYASIETSGTGHFQLRALWLFVKDGKTAKVTETSMEFDTTGPAWNEFHIENNQDWPKGDYRVEIFLGAETAPAATRTFKVQ